MIGLPGNTHVAYWLDEAVIYFGLTLESMLEEAGHKPGKAEKKAERARERLLKKVFGEEEAGTGFADPALMFK